MQLAERRQYLPENEGLRNLVAIESEVAQIDQEIERLERGKLTLKRPPSFWHGLTMGNFVKGDVSSSLCQSSGSTAID
jgi:hypothetical protein